MCVTVRWPRPAIVSVVPSPQSIVALSVSSAEGSPRSTSSETAPLEGTASGPVTAAVGATLVTVTVAS